MLRHALFQLKQQAANRPALRLHARLAAEERLSSDELEAMGFERLRGMVAHARKQTPYYRRVLAAVGLEAGDLRRPEDALGIPILEKEALRRSFDDLTARDSRPTWRRLSTTGGSTGEPVRVWFDTRVPLEAFAWRVLDWWGLHPGDHAAYVFRTTRTGWRNLANEALWWPTRRLFLDAAALTPESIGDFLARWRDLRPPLLQGYMGALGELAESLGEVRPDFVQAVWSTSAPLPAPARRRMEEQFQAPVYDQYGCGEVFWLACECPERAGLHVFTPSRRVEIVDPQGRPVPPGEWGDVLVTDLENRVFPILRYRNGDRGRLLPGRCPCGRGLPRLDSIQGRVSDSLRLPGLVLAGDFLTTLFDGCPEAVRAFQVRQLRDQSILLRCVPGAGESARRQAEAVAENLRHRVAGRVPVRLEWVERIEHDRGKTRFVVRETEGEA
jgi:phenylacetate-CoA ligase